MASEGYRVSPLVWGNAALAMYDRLEANELFAEKNFGGDMVLSTLRTAAGDQLDCYNLVVGSASRGKDIRAEPIAALYQKGRVHHVGVFPELEEQQISFPVEAEIKDRLDAAVWLVIRAQLRAAKLPLFMVPGDISR